jgi:hypothetical protein
MRSAWFVLFFDRVYAQDIKGTCTLASTAKAKTQNPAEGTSDTLSDLAISAGSKGLS